MSAKSLLITGALALAGVPFVYGASYEVVFSTPVEVGNTTLGPGAYRVEAKKSEAEFTNLRTHKMIKIPATVQHLATKNHSENVAMNYQDGQARIESIQVGGHAKDLQFLR